MSKALLGPGTGTMPSQLHLLDEVRSLRQRILELEARLAEAESLAADRETMLDLVEESAAR